MVHDTPARQHARELRGEAHNLSRDAGTLAGIGGLEAEATARQERVKVLQEEARAMKAQALGLLNNFIQLNPNAI